MSVGIQYNKTTGAICATIRPPVPDGQEFPEEIAQIVVPDGTTVEGMMIDLETLSLKIDPQITSE